jgi:hypothetical protein
VARKDNTSREAPLGPDLRRRTPDPYEVQVRSYRGDMLGPLGGPQVPPSEVRALARSRDREVPVTDKGPVPTRV